MKNPENNFPSTPIQEAIVPHSNENGVGIEVPVEEFKSESTGKTIPLDRAIGKGYTKFPTGEIALTPEGDRFITVNDPELTDTGSDPQSQETNNDIADTTETTPTTVESTPSHPGRSVAIGAATLLLAGGAVTGVVLANNQPSNTPPEANPSATGAPVPGETQAPTARPSSEVSPSADPSNITPLETASPTTPEVRSNYTAEQLKALSVEDYNKLPRADRLVLIEHMLKEAREVSLSYGEVYEYNPLDVAAKDNTAQDIMKQLQFADQLTFNQGITTESDDTRLDKDAAKKALSGYFYNTTGEVSPVYTRAVNYIDNSGVKGPVRDEFNNVKEVDIPKTLVDQEGKTIEYRTIDFTGVDGEPHTVRVVLTPLTKGKSIWQVYSSN